jgi:hypothetical protein
LDAETIHDAISLKDIDLNTAIVGALAIAIQRSIPFAVDEEARERGAHR